MYMRGAQIKVHTPLKMLHESRAGLNYCGALCETDCLEPSLDRNKDNNYSRDKRGTVGSAGPTAAAYVAVASGRPCMRGAQIKLYIRLKKVHERYPIKSAHTYKEGS